VDSSAEYILQANRERASAQSDPFTRERYRQMAGFLPRRDGLRILDVGSGVGRGGGEVKRLLPSARLTGLDCVPERVESLPKDLYEVGVCSFSHEIPLPMHSFDAIVAGEFVEHIPPQDVDRSLAEFQRLLVPGGVLVLTTPNPRYLRNVLTNYSIYQDPAHLIQHYPDCLRWRLRCLGFRGIKIRGCGKVTRYLGPHFPWLNVYGSYLISAVKW